MTDPAYNDAIAKAVKKLARKDWFVAEMSSYLAGEGFTADVVDAATAHLKRRSFIDDRRLIRNSIEKHRHDHGIAWIRQRLSHRGALEEDLDAELAEVSEVEAAVLAARKKFPKGEDSARIARFLSSRGFAEETIESVLSDLHSQ